MSPVLTRLHHCVEYGQHLSHAGRQRQLLRLPCRKQPLIEGSEHRIVSTGDQRTHVEHRAQSGLPPQTLRLPRRGPLSLLKGATPTRAAIRLRFSVPNSGKYASSDNESCSPTPCTERRRSSFSRHTGLLRRVCRRSLSRSFSSCSSHLMWDLYHVNLICRLRQ